MSLVDALTNPSMEFMCGTKGEAGRLCDVQVIEMTKEAMMKIPRSSLELYSPFSFSNATRTYVVVVNMRVTKKEWNAILHKYQDISYVTGMKPNKECTQVANEILRQLIISAGGLGTFQVFRVVIYFDCEAMMRPSCLSALWRGGVCWRHKRYRDSVPFARCVRRELGLCARDATVFVDYGLDSVATMHGQDIASAIRHLTI